MAINWVDRVATHPGRVQLTPVQGQTNIYDMERADEPTVAGTPINAANLNAMQKNAGLDVWKTVYVAVSGSDSTGNGSSTAPYQTITKAISTIPKNLNGFGATINIASGNYNEDVFIEKTFGGVIFLFGEEGTQVSIKSLRVFNGSTVEIDVPLSITGALSDNGVYVVNATLVAVKPVTISGTTSYGLFATRNAYCRFSSLNVSNSSVGAITATNVSQVSVASASGSNNNIGIRVADGGLIAYNSNTMSATTLYLSQTGGRIYAGSQTSIPNY